MLRNTSLNTVNLRLVKFGAVQTPGADATSTNSVQKKKQDITT